MGGGMSGEGPPAARVDGGWGTGGRAAVAEGLGRDIRGCGQREMNDTDGNGWEAGYSCVLNK